MAQTLAARATSFGASALVMGGLGLLALTMSFVVRDRDWGAPPAPIEMTRPEEPPPPPAPTARPQTQPLDEEPFEVLPVRPVEPINAPDPRASNEVPTAVPGPIEITSPHWQRRPSDLTRFYPQRALAHNVEGEVLLDCLVRVSGLLDCRVVSESPAGWGFAAAALRIASAHRMIPAIRDGIAVEGRYVMRVPFQIEQG